MLDVPSPSTVTLPPVMRRQGEEVAGGRGVGLDGVRRGRDSARVDVEAAELAVVDRHAEGFHHRQSHGHVRLRDEGALDLDRGHVLGIGQCHQETAQELARDVSLDEGVAAGETAGLDRHRRAARAQVGTCVGAQAVERIEQVGDRPLPHPRAAVEVESSRCRGQHGGQKPQAGPRIRQVQRRRSAPEFGPSSPAP